jgi:peptide/nickel transport system ATP-binding protein
VTDGEFNIKTTDQLFISLWQIIAICLSILLEVRSLSKRFMMKKSFWQSKAAQYSKAVDNVSFDLDRGKVLVIAGESGSGKTTLARLVMGAIRPDSGLISFDGNDVTRFTNSQLKQFRSYVHMVYQDPYASLDPRMKILDIVMEPLNIHDKASTRQQKIEKVLKALEEVRLEPAEEIAAKYPHALSGGQRQRVALARAIILKPKLIVADEPVSMLDVSVRAETLGLMMSLKERLQISFIYITHDLSTARYVGDSVIIMYRGQIIEKGPIDTVLLNPLHPYTQALIKAIPDPDGTPEDMPTYHDTKITDDEKSSTGCKYYGRCLHAMEACKKEPVLVKAADSHHVSCFLYDGKE